MGGSKWRKWDLHVHTPSSFHQQFRFENDDEKTKYEEDIWKKYIDELENVSDVCALGITDYYSIEGYKKILEFVDEGRLSNFDLILPNIEFRLDKLVDPKKINFHIIFSNEIPISEIESEFLSQLQIKTPHGETRSLIRDNIEYVGRLLKQQHSGFTDSDYAVGCKNITVSKDQIIKVLEEKKSIFAGKYISILSAAEWSIINWDGGGHLTKKEILVGSDAIFSSNPSTIEWALGKKEDSHGDFISEFGGLKPCLHGSDAHSFDKICQPDENRFCWIKADPTFEGLKQILYEPEERIKIQEYNPEHVKNIYTITGVSIQNSNINDSLSIKETSIPLNSNLVTITGGKGTGKTALLDLIANCFDNRCSSGEKDSNSFVQRIESQKPDLKTELEFLGHEIENYSKELCADDFFTESKIMYLPQGKIDEYSSNRNKLDEKIREIIFNSESVKEGAYKEKFDELDEKIHELSEEIKDTYISIIDLEDETKQELINEMISTKKIKEGELKNIDALIVDLKEKLSDDSEEKINKIKIEETKLQKHSLALFNTIQDVYNIKYDLNTFLQKSEETITMINTHCTALNLDLQIPSIDLTDQLNVIEDAIGDITKEDITQMLQGDFESIELNPKILTQEIIEVDNKIRNINEELNKFVGTEKEHTDLLKQKEEVLQAIENCNLQLRTIEKKKDTIKQLNEKINRLQENIFETYLLWKRLYNEVIDTFSSGKNKILGDIDFISEIKFSKKEFAEFGCDIFDGRKVSNTDIESYADNYQTLLNSIESPDFSDKLNDFLEDLLSNKPYLKERTRTSYDLYKWIYSNYLGISAQIVFKGTSMDKLSMGQKGTVLLKLFLAEGNYPLIVDQPEDNLDNKFIFEEVVTAFRDAKKDRQIIIATNNANLVVNTDAEQIIVAEYENNEIRYNIGTLENKEIRKAILPILEGGDTAFNQREKRYEIGMKPFINIEPSIR